MDFLRKHLPTSAGRYVERYLKGIEFPIRKEELVGRLEANGVPGAVVSQVRKRLPEGEYRGPKDVLDALRRRWRQANTTRTTALGLPLGDGVGAALTGAGTTIGDHSSPGWYPASPSGLRRGPSSGSAFGRRVRGG
jgi:Protein of unknown function (DUF2795)